MRRRLGYGLVALWIAAGLLGLVSGVQNGALDSANDVGAAWGGELGRRVTTLEGALDQVRELGWERVAFVHSDGSNPMLALATHRLFPCQVVKIFPGRKDPAKGLVAAQRLGLDGLIRLDQNASWQVLEVKP